jgi:exosortase E/protease (VPEID-CTERM system)
VAFTILSHLVQNSPGEVPLAADGSFLRARIVYLVALLSVELIVISVWLDNASLSNGLSLVALVRDWGAWTVRIAVATLIFSLVIIQTRTESSLGKVSSRLIGQPIAWRSLLFHAGGIALFSVLSWFLFNTRTSARLGDVTVICWVASGVFAAMAAALAFAPGAVWLAILRNTGNTWIYAISAGIGTYLLGVSAWKLWQPLSGATFMLVRAILGPFIPILISDPSTLTIGSRNFLVSIAPECSGYEGIGLVLAFIGAWLWFFRGEWRYPRALLLLPVGAIVIWLFNSVRIAALILIGAAGGVRIALGGFHSQAGWIAFTAVTIGICLGSRRVTWLVRTHPAETRESLDVAANASTPYLAPILLLLTAALISRSASADFEWLYPLRTVAAAVPIWWFRRTYQKLDWRVGWPAVPIGCLVFGIWVMANHWSGERLAAAMPLALAQSSQIGRISWIALSIIGTVVVVPIAEELAYRGFLMRRLTSKFFESVSWQHFSWMALAVSSVTYGALQGREWLAGTIAGCCYALAVLRKGRIGEAVVAHATANGLIAAWIIFSGNWQMW